MEKGNAHDFGRKESNDPRPLVCHQLLQATILMLYRSKGLQTGYVTCIISLLTRCIMEI